MTKTRMLTIAVAGLLLVNFGLLAFLVFSRPGNSFRGTGPRHGTEGPKEIIIKKLDFNKEQVAAYEQLIDGHKANIQKLNDEVRNTKNKLYATLANDTALSADSLTNRLGTLQVQIEKLHYDHFAAIAKLCGPDQKDKFQDLTKELANYFELPRNPPPPKP